LNLTPACLHHVRPDDLFFLPVSALHQDVGKEVFDDPYRALVATTGKEAVELAKTFDGQIDLARLDIKLPDMDGGRVYPLIMAARPDLKTIVCSGYSIGGPARPSLMPAPNDSFRSRFIFRHFSLIVPRSHSYFPNCIPC